MQAKVHELPALFIVADSDLNGPVKIVETEEKGWKKDAALLLHQVCTLPQAKLTCFWKELSILKQISFVIHSKSVNGFLMLAWCIITVTRRKFLLETAEQNAK